MGENVKRKGETQEGIGYREKEEKRKRRRRRK